jgi:hypothetical protein
VHCRVFTRCTWWPCDREDIEHPAHGHQVPPLEGPRLSFLLRRRRGGWFDPWGSRRAPIAARVSPKETCADVPTRRSDDPGARRYIVPPLDYVASCAVKWTTLRSTPKAFAFARFPGFARLPKAELSEVWVSAAEAYPLSSRVDLPSGMRYPFGDAAFLTGDTPALTGHSFRSIGLGRRR